MEVYQYELSSSIEMDDILNKLEKIKEELLVIHMFSYMENRVLVQNLIAAIEKKFPNVEFVLFKHEEKLQIKLNVYASSEYAENDVFAGNVGAYIIEKLNKKNIFYEENVVNTKKETLKRYFTDHLTNLPNIYKLRKVMQDNENYGLVAISIDNFLTINNFYGSIIGDYVIEEVSKYLKENIDSTIYRVGGTEFALLLETRLPFHELKKYLNDLYEKIKYIVIHYQNTEIILSVTLASSGDNNYTDMFSKVSMAMKYAKDNSLPFWIYEGRMGFENEYEKNLRASSMVKHAVLNSKIIPYFQPIINNRTSKIEKYECLARLLDENDNVQSPDIFIPIAKKTKVYHQITRTIIEKSFEVFKNNDFQFSINLTSEDIMSSNIFDFIIDKLKNSDTNISERVVFEIVESEAIKDFQKINRFIKEVKRYGARIAIDDFGDGYSNFSYLMKMDVDYIKIDGTLIKNIDVDPNASLVVETIVSFAHKLGIQVVAEYVHSSTVLDKVKSLDIDFSQGFFIDRPKLEIGL